MKLLVMDQFSFIMNRQKSKAFENNEIQEKETSKNTKNSGSNKWKKK